jgi:hypothetical protein
VEALNIDPDNLSRVFTQANLALLLRELVNATVVDEEEERTAEETGLFVSGLDLVFPGQFGGMDGDSGDVTVELRTQIFVSHFTVCCGSMEGFMEFDVKSSLEDIFKVKLDRSQEEEGDSASKKRTSVLHTPRILM